VRTEASPVRCSDVLHATDPRGNLSIAAAHARAASGQRGMSAIHGE
jgi:hypothetical protein